MARQGGPATKETRTLSAVLLGRRGCCCILCSAVQCCIVQCSAVQCSAVQCSRCCCAGGAAVQAVLLFQTVLLDRRCCCWGRAARFGSCYEDCGQSSAGGGACGGGKGGASPLHTHGATLRTEDDKVGWDDPVSIVCGRQASGRWVNPTTSMYSCVSFVRWSLIWDWCWQDWRSGTGRGWGRGAEGFEHFSRNPHAQCWW